MSSIDISTELDLLSLEIDMDEELEESQFKEDNYYEEDTFDDEKFNDGG